MFFQKNKLIILAFLLALGGCASAKFNEDFMEDYGFICPDKIDKAIAKGLKTEKINGKVCFKIKVDKDAAADYYLREWQKDSLPEMPELQ
jgi:hypothetical protein